MAVMGLWAFILYTGLADVCMNFNCKRDAYVRRFYEYSRSTRKSKAKQNKKQAKSYSYFTRMAEQRTFWQRNHHRAWA